MSYADLTSLSVKRDIQRGIRDLAGKKMLDTTLSDVAERLILNSPPYNLVLEVMDKLKAKYISGGRLDVSGMVDKACRLFLFGRDMPHPIPMLFWDCAHQIERESSILVPGEAKEKLVHPSNWAHDGKQAIIYRAIRTSKKCVSIAISIEPDSDTANQKVAILNKRTLICMYYSERCPAGVSIEDILKLERPGSGTVFQDNSIKPKYSVIETGEGEGEPKIFHCVLLQPAYVYCKTLKERWEEHGFEVRDNIERDKQYRAFSKDKCVKTVQITAYIGEIEE